MSYKFPEGTRLYYSSTFAATKTVSALTNANPASATATSHGYSDNDEVLFVSGWEDANNTVFRVDQQDTNTFTFLGLDSSSTTLFPAGSGVGTTAKISSWVAIPQILGVSTSGGDPRYTTISPLASRNSVNIPTGFNPSNMTLQMGHDPTDSTQLAMIALSRVLTPVAFKLVLGGGGTTYAYGYMAVSEVPTMNQNQVNTVQVALSFQGRQISYST